MYILNYILLAAIVLFALSMTLICLGLFLKPRNKSQNIDDINQDLFFTSYADDEEDEYEEDVEDSADDLDENADIADEDDSEDDIDDTKEDTEENSDNSNKSDGIEISITVIDSNKKHKITVSDEIVIGRNPKCDVIINKPMVSSMHCILYRENNKIMAEDNHSTNGTMLNGKPLHHMIELKNNDVITLGDRSIRINF